MTGSREIFLAAFPDRPIGSIRRPTDGNRKETAIVTSEDGGRVVVQQSDDREPLQTETAITREIAARTPVPVPAVTRAERLTAVIRSAVDGDGNMTRPGCPERTAEAAAAFRREHLTELL